MIDSDYKREHDIMEGLTDEQHDLLFDLVFRGEHHKSQEREGERHPFFVGSGSYSNGTYKENQSFEAFPSGTDHGHSIIDSLIQKNNLMNVLKDPEAMAYMFHGTPDSLFPYSGEPRDAVFSPQTQSFESYDERNPKNINPNIHPILQGEGGPFSPNRPLDNETMRNAMYYFYPSIAKYQYGER